ncbi:hypothetical protein SAMN05444392_101341 [Seinonella peptonophila]|uniref:Uncharacterized protein n=1 Tax=Seinonella peptonophila TaxID=112248 RepID=A0A1M4T7B7_9BACL|nr:hypothetical protein SAMN05444392_101341 [Seinonella peptonophila]
MEYSDHPHYCHRHDCEYGEGERCSEGEWNEEIRDHISNREAPNTF